MSEQPQLLYKNRNVSGINTLDALQMPEQEAI